MKHLQQISVVGMGLLGASITLTILRSMPWVKAVGYSHRDTTREKARRFGVASEIVDDMGQSVANADIVILATPISTFEGIFIELADKFKDGCIVTDVGSTKMLPHQWAQKHLKNNVRYVGSHPIAGSEKNGVEYARDDLFFGSKCIITKKANTDPKASATLEEFWSKLGCAMSIMTPAQHDKIFGLVSHLPHVTATALVNASNPEQMRFAGKGFVDTSRVASGPANVWSDILMANAGNTSRGIDRVIKELQKIKKAIDAKNQKQIAKLLEQARTKREDLINYKIKQKELL